MKANEIIRMIADNANTSMAPSTDPRSMIALSDIKAVLEDGEALFAFGFEDCDQEVIEEAHETICGWIICGLDYYHDAA